MEGKTERNLFLPDDCQDYISSKLEDIIQGIPFEPGCYIMKDNTERILYIGKSKNLKNRVKSYFREYNNHTPRINLMVKQIADIEFIVTDTEDEALVLESNLIKNYQPYFNILLKDDKKYPYLCITWSEKYPRIFVTRRRRNRKEADKYYGPYVDVGLLRNTLALVKKVFPLRQRPIPLYQDRVCLNYSIGRCPGVCQKLITPEEYQRTIKQIAMIFQGRNDELKRLLTHKMKCYSDQQNYESAALIRDQLKGLSQLTTGQKMSIPDSTLSLDAIALAYNEKNAVVQIFKMRSGKLIGTLCYSTERYNQQPPFIIQRIIEEHYSIIDSFEIPSEIITQYILPQNDVIRDWLTELKGSTISIKQPKRNTKAKLLKLVERNANYELARTTHGILQNEIAIEDLAQLLEMDSLPKRIEAYDISHIQGSDAVGSQVVFIDGLPAKQHYRKYKIKNEEIRIGHSDDYKSLEEVIRRRFKKWANLKKSANDFDVITRSKPSILSNSLINDWPDLVLIDGGKGQLSSVFNVLQELGLSEEINLCSIAKQKEEVFIPGSRKPINSEPNQLGIKLLRRLRDEAHRFAVSYHRQIRSNNLRKSSLSVIPGLGSKKIKSLLSHFNSIDAIQLATVDQLTRVDGIGDSTAELIYNYFNVSQQSKPSDQAKN